MESYIVRIYRRDAKRPTRMHDVVEHVGTQQRQAFHSLRALIAMVTRATKDSSARKRAAPGRPRNRTHGIMSIVAPMLVCLLAGCTSSSSDDPSAYSIEMSIIPSIITVAQGETGTVRVDLKGLPDGAGVAGFSIDLPETEARINIDTQSCPPGSGTTSCQDWAITPGSNSTPGDYRVKIRPVGATVPIQPGELILRVVADPPTVTPPAVAVDSSDGDSGAFGHTLFITTDGRLWGYGSNWDGQVSGSYRRTDSTGSSILDVQPEKVPVPIALGPLPWRWKAVVASGTGSFALRDDGHEQATLWWWGRDDRETPDNHTDDLWQVSPVQLHPNLNEIRAMSAIDRHSWLMLDNAGRVYAGGSSEPISANTRGSVLDGVIAVAGGTPPPSDGFGIRGTLPNHGNGYVLKGDGQVAKIYGVFGWGDESESIRVRRLTIGGMVGEGWSDITAIAAGTDHVLALRRDGVVLAAGKNEKGQLGNGSTDAAPFNLECAPHQGCLGEAWFDNASVEVLNSATAIAAKGDRSFALLADGTVWTWGKGILSPIQVQNLDNVKIIGPGYAIRNDCPGAGGTLWGIEFPDGAPPTAMRVPGVGFDSGCTIPSFTLVLGASTLTLTASTQHATSVTLTRSGYNGEVDLTVLDCPTNVQCTANPDPIPGALNAATLTITTNNATPGNYVITVRGTGGGITSEALLELRIVGL